MKTMTNKEEIKVIHNIKLKKFHVEYLDKIAKANDRPRSYIIAKLLEKAIELQNSDELSMNK